MATFDVDKFRGQVDKLDIAAQLDLRWQFKEKIAALQATIEEEVETLNGKIAVIEKAIGKQILPDMKTITTKERRVTASTRTSVSIADADLFYATLTSRILEGEPHMDVFNALERRVKSSWASEYVDAHKVAPAGVNIVTGRVLVFS